MLFFSALLVAAIALSLPMLWQPLWKRRVFRLYLAWQSAILMTLASAGLLVTSWGIVTVLVVLVSLYSLLNLARIIAGRSHEHYLLQSAGRTLVWLGIVHIVLLQYALASAYLHMSWSYYLGALVLLQLAVAIIIGAAVRRQLRTTYVPDEGGKLSASASDVAKLPTVTVAIAARDDGEQLEACLSAVLANDYPKMEVLALADVHGKPQDRTPLVIRQFAQAGVRFVRAPKVNDGWLPKNQARAELAAAASGDYILFLDSDIRLDRQAIRRLVDVGRRRGKLMIAVLPVSPSLVRLPMLQAIRYYWEMAPPRRLFQKPPIMNSCWMIERHMLERAGGFPAARRSVTPEALFAHYATRNGDAYSFIRSSEGLGVSSHKPLQDQRSSAIYNRYPQLHRRPELVLLLSAAELAIVLGPLWMLLILPLVPSAWWLLPLAAVAAFIQVRSFVLVQQAVYPAVRPWRAAVAFVPVLLLDIAASNSSMYKYEFSTVQWREYNVAAPVMRRDRAVT